MCGDLVIFLQVSGKKSPMVCHDLVISSKGNPFYINEMELSEKKITVGVCGDLVIFMQVSWKTSPMVCVVIW